jgi:WD40 repeat protein
MWSMESCIAEEWCVAKELAANDNQQINGLAVSPSSDVIATSDDVGLLRVLDLRGKVVTQTRAVVGKQAFGLSVNRDASLLASTGTDRRIRLWDFSRCSPRACRLREPVQPLELDAIPYATTFSPDGRWLAVGLGDRTVRVWDVQALRSGRRKPRVLDLDASLSSALAFSRHGEFLAVASSDRRVRVFGTKRWRIAGTLQPHSGRINTVRFSPKDARMILTTSDDGTAVLSRCETCVPLDALRKQAEARLRALRVP